jgi:protein-S-isoprenylcysteine O-methyltransferase Ste14
VKQSAPVGEAAGPALGPGEAKVEPRSGADAGRASSAASVAAFPLRACARRAIDPASGAAMRKGSALVGSAVFTVLVPGVVAGLGPWLLTRWQVRTPTPWSVPVRLLGLALVVAGAGTLLPSILRFAIEGLGTPAPVAPTRRLVVGGAYRFVRNPMYVAVLATLVGQALWLGQPALLAYAAVFLATVATFVRAYEEPVLRRTFGAEYDAYARAVPRWWPRLRGREPAVRDAAARCPSRPDDERA